MSRPTDPKLGRPTHCWNCASPLPVFTYSCGICGTDNTPLDEMSSSAGVSAGSEGDTPPSSRAALKAALERQRKALRDSLKRK